MDENWEDEDGAEERKMEKKVVVSLSFFFHIDSECFAWLFHAENHCCCYT